MTQTDPTVRHVAAPARTDVQPAPWSPEPGSDAPRPAVTRVLGGALTVFSAAWALSFPLGVGPGSVLGTVVAVAFQLSLLGLLALIWRTRGTGARVAGRVLLGIEMAVLGLATVQSASEAVPGALADTVTTVLDPCWPASMLGMFVVGITVAVAGRWRGAARVWAPVATSWIAFLPVMMIASEGVGGFVATGHVLVGYAVLGVILAVRPGLTTGR